jgi:hypothetical protein
MRVNDHYHFIHRRIKGESDARAANIANMEASLPGGPSQTVVAQRRKKKRDEEAKKEASK